MYLFHTIFSKTKRHKEYINDTKPKRTTDDWIEINRNCFGHIENFHCKIGKYYLITRHFPTGNKKMELLKCDCKNMFFPEFTTAIQELDIKPYGY